ncbi:MAG: hypothetical protein M5U33_01780 [Pseudorhodoplanes sp.]|nr:hypothetical protein [Pseudorhodoplanes sp.]
MRLILFFLGGFMLANLVVAGSSMIRPQAHEQQRMFRDANKSAPAPWTANERYIEPTRKNARRSALDALAMPLAVACSSTGRAQIVDALAFYYGQRARSGASMPKPGARTAAASPRRPGPPPTTAASSG